MRSGAKSPTPSIAPSRVCLFHCTSIACWRSVPSPDRKGTVMDDLLQEFLAETNESLSVLDVELVRFERDSSDVTILSNIFRLMHTIKGTCGFLGLPRLGSVAHAGENVLGKFRDGELEVTPLAVTLILKAIDQIRVLLTEMETTGVEPAGSDAELIDEINGMASGGSAAPAPASAEPSVEGPHFSDAGFPVAA